MAARLPEAERLRRHNEEMQLALAENLTLAEARRRLVEKRIGASKWARDQRLAQIERQNLERWQRCGTADHGERTPFWWERD
jgi:hypothetical protein